MSGSYAATSRSFCWGCFEKQPAIDRLQEEIQRLKQQLRTRERQAEEGCLGSSTPSAKIPIRANTPEPGPPKNGGAAPGHPGHGRKSKALAEADPIRTIRVKPGGPQCGGPLRHKGVRQRSVLDTPPLAAERIVYRLERKYCPRCNDWVQARPPGVLPKMMLGNQLITRIVILHYRDGIPLGTVCRQLGVLDGTAVQMRHRLAALFQGVIPYLIEQYRQQLVRHADETGGRTEGHSG